MAGREFGSLTKEPPLARLDETIAAIRPGMSYGELLDYARTNTHDAAPGLIRKRFILVNSDSSIAYDHFLSLVAAHGINSPLVRKTMFFVWAFRDERVRRFICEKVADSRGEWRTGRLANKANASFFEEWLQPGAARKARSNIEFFLAEAGIYDPNRSAIHLELDDGWLHEAAVVAAQHEDDPARRRRLVEDPGRFLVEEGWSGLINASADDLRVLGPNPVDELPLEDSALEVDKRHPSPTREWNRKKPKPSDKKTANVLINMVARERANQSHHMLEQIVAAAIRGVGCRPEYNENIDMYFASAHGSVLFEIKSCDDGNVHSQIRKGISQLLEYRYVYRGLLGEKPVLALIVESVPPKEKRWLVDFLEALGIVIGWKEAKSDKIVSSCRLPPALSGVVNSEI